MGCRIEAIGRFSGLGDWMVQVLVVEEETSEVGGLSSQKYVCERCRG